jgi:hypothetical protein
VRLSGGEVDGDLPGSADGRDSDDRGHQQRMLARSPETVGGCSRRWMASAVGPRVSVPASLSIVPSATAGGTVACPVWTWRAVGPRAPGEGAVRDAGKCPMPTVLSMDCGGFPRGHLRAAADHDARERFAVHGGKAQLPHHRV